MSNNKLKIIVFSQKYLSQRVIFEFALDELATYADLEYWDISELVGLHFDDSCPDKLIRSYVKKIDTKEDFYKRLSSVSPQTIAVINIFKQYSTYWIHKEIAAKVSCAVIIQAKTTYFSDIESLGHSLLCQDKEFNSTKGKIHLHYSVYRKLKNFLYSKSELFQSMAKYLKYKGGYRYKLWRDGLYCKKSFDAYKSVYFVGMSSKCDYITCAPEYDEIRNMAKEKTKHKPYIVFMDLYYPKQLDLYNRVPNFGWSALETPYHTSLNAFFEKIEQEYKCQVIIAAHPNAQYDNNAFNGRKCVKYKSLELVKDALAVVTHATSAITYVIYYDKPFCFITNNALKAGDFALCPYAATKNMSLELNMPFIDIDHCSKSMGEIFKKIDPQLRIKFLNLYFGNIESNKTYAEQLKDALIDIHNRIKQ